MATPDQQFMANDLLYNIDDPAFSFNNALRDSGINPYAANPFVRNLRQAAPGLAQSYVMSKALNGGTYAPGPQVNDFGAYLKNNIQGGSIYGTLDRAGRQDFGRAIQGVRDYRNQVGQNPNGQTASLNPWMALLSEQLGENDGMGTVDAMTAMLSPTMGSANLARSYRSGLQNSREGGLRRLAQSGDMQGDIWKYMLGF